MEILIFCVYLFFFQYISFPNNQFVYQYNQSIYIGYYRKQRWLDGVFVKSHIPSRRLSDFKIPSDIQIIPFEINLRNKKWLVASIYKAASIQIFSQVFDKSVRILLNSV